MHSFFFVLFSLACLNYRYGEDCALKCGHCKAREVCDKKDGRCSACADGYAGAQCKNGSDYTKYILVYYM